MSEEQLPITPETTVAALLDAYPELETVLVGLAPAFKNLRNPVLRRTVAKVATLDRAARIAGIPPRELVARLRAQVGQPVDSLEDVSMQGGRSCAEPGCHTPPVVDHPSCDWLCESRIVERIDADALLATGVSPLAKVLGAAKLLQKDGILAVSVAFRPIPLIETLQKQGFRTACRETRRGAFELLVCTDPKT